MQRCLETVPCICPPHTVSTICSVPSRETPRITPFVMSDGGRGKPLTDCHISYCTVASETCGNLQATLKECIRQRGLSNGGRQPVRESKLTMLLKDALCLGNDHAVSVVACVSPCSSDTEHTLNTVRNAVYMAGGAISDVRSGQFGLHEEQVCR
jgi:Kinesin motor domain